ncbi:MAG: PQQ-binding-like beta-propeller repeat protein [Solirubrobacterales bacterium]
MTVFPSPPGSAARASASLAALTKTNLAACLLAALAGVLAICLLAPVPALAKSHGFHYAVPVQQTSPWPEMRRDSRNTGASPIRARYRGGRPWRFRTLRGIFSTPVIGGDGTVYVGSADHDFYALGPGGGLRWRFRTGGIIDSAAAIGAYDRHRRTTPITIGSGDEVLYHLRGERRHLRRERRVIWRFRPTEPPATGQLVSWWEGNPAIGPDGLIYDGNTGGGAYAIRPNGTGKWAYRAGNSVWTTPAFGPSGRTYWGSVDLTAFALKPDGQPLWKRTVAGYVTSSPAIGSDGTVYVGAFDRQLHALDPDTGADRWSFATAEHIYGSPALSHDAQGDTTAIYVGSADGTMYALRPDGSLLWRYDTGDPIRSSPAVGRKPGGKGDIVYFGSSNGKLYALDAATGRRRWSFDTTPAAGALRDRNDLNGSPALGRRGIYIGGEHGYLTYVPYDYCLHRRDPRCDRSPGQEFGSLINSVFFVTPGGTTERRPKAPLSPATVIGTRLIVRKGGVTVNARMVPSPDSDSLVTATPSFPFHTELSGDGHFLFVRPDGLLRPGTSYRLRIAGNWAAPSDSGSFDDTIRFRTSRGGGALPLRRGKRRVGALKISRLALPEPALLPSVNQIGFDSYDMIAGTLRSSRPQGRRPGHVLLWVVGARRAAGRLLADPRGNFAFPLSGTYRGGQLALNASKVNLQFSFGPVPLRSLDFRGRLGSEGRFEPGASMFGQVTCSEVPNYSVYLYVAGVCNPDDTLAASGAFLSDRYRGGPANRRPAGVSVAKLSLKRPAGPAGGEALATLRLTGGARYPAAAHLGSILLVNAATGEPVPLDYRSLIANGSDARGNLRTIRLQIPAGTALPAGVRAYVIGDVFPLGSRAL